MTTAWRLALLLGAVVLLSLDAAAQGEKTIVLVTGEETSLPFPPLSRVDVKNPKIARVDVLADGKRILLRGLRPGETDLTVWSDSGEQRRITVHVSPPVDTVLEDVRKTLRDVEGVSVERVGTNVVLRGSIHTDKDKQRVAKLLEMYPKVQNFLSLKTGERRAFLIKSLQEELQMPSVSVEPLGEKGIALTGTVFSAESGRRAERTASLFFPFVSNFLNVQPPTLRIELELLEMGETAVCALGTRLKEHQRERALIPLREVFPSAKEADEELSTLQKEGAVRRIQALSETARDGQKIRLNLTEGEIAAAVTSRLSEAGELFLKIEIEPIEGRGERGSFYLEEMARLEEGQVLLIAGLKRIMAKWPVPRSDAVGDTLLVLRWRRE